jgi:hypothetical protein
MASDLKSKGRSLADEPLPHFVNWPEISGQVSAEFNRPTEPDFAPRNETATKGFVPIPRSPVRVARDRLRPR